MRPAYSEYKTTKLDWLESVPKNWNLVKLKHVSSLNMGQSPSSDDVNQEGEGIPFIQGNAEFGALHPTPKNFCTEPSKICSPNDILISVRAPVGALNIADQEYVIGRGLSAITPKSVRKGFCWYALQNSQYQLSVMETGTTFKAISGSDLANVFLPLPSPEEQRAIEGYLNFETSRIDRLIAEKTGFIDLLKEKRQALISHVVTKGLDPDVEMKDSGTEWVGRIPKAWSCSSLKHFAKVIDCKHITAEFFDDGVPLASIGEVKEWVVNLKKAKRTNDKYYRDLISGGRRPEPGDIIYSRNATVGKSAIVPENIEKFALGQDVCIIKIMEELDSEYLMYSLRSVSMTEQLEVLMVGATFKRVNVDDIRNFKITAPPIDQQKEIAHFLNRECIKIKNLVSEVERSIRLLNEHRTALISAAVTGKIDLRDKEVA
jgi:type I restriction enzyme S subunit